MTLLPETINDYLTLWKILDNETERVFRPIMHKVRRPFKDFLLSTVDGLMWTEWLIKPLVCIPAHGYRYLVLMLWPVSESKMDMVLFERYERHILESDEVNSKEKDWESEIMTMFPDYRLRLLLEPDWEDKNSYLTFIREVARFSINTKLTAKLVAKTIDTEARKIHNEQTAAALECRKQRNNILATGCCQATCLDTANPST